MEVLKSIEERRSIREFKSDEPSKEVSEDILNCAVALGYANQAPKQRPRKDLKDIIEWIG